MRIICKLCRHSCTVRSLLATWMWKLLPDTDLRHTLGTVPIMVARGHGNFHIDTPLVLASEVGGGRGETGEKLH